MDLFGIIVSASITIFSFALLVISVLSYWRYRNIKVLFIAAITVLFFIRGIIFSLGLFQHDILTMTAQSSFWLFDVVILLFLYMTALKR
jgi:hypothetical protein